MNFKILKNILKGKGYWIILPIVYPEPITYATYNVLTKKIADVKLSKELAKKFCKQYNNL